MKILMVCLGNICRSPLAQGIMESVIEEKNLNWEVESAGTGSWHTGELPDHRSIEVARENGIDITNQRSRQITPHDIEEYDVIVAMDTSNYNNIIQMCTTEEEKNKVKLMLNYLHPGENRSVPDPYLEGGFSNVYKMLYQACRGLTDTLLKQK